MIFRILLVSLFLSMSIGALGESVMSDMDKLEVEDRQASVPGLSGMPMYDNSYPSHIFFSSDNQSTFFVNGKEISTVYGWTRFSSLISNLNVGDVIAIRATGSKKSYLPESGLITALFFKGKLHVTGRDNWKATNAFTTSNEWMLPSYSACFWPKARTLPNPNIWKTGRSLYFPYYTGARYVWAQNAGKGDTIFLRYRIGGENCSVKSNFTFSADNTISVYVNGRHVGSGKDWRYYYNGVENLEDGDVIGVIAEDFGVWYGAFVSIVMGSRRIRTGIDEWKAIKGFDKTMWLYKPYNSCKWSPAEIRAKGVYTPGKASPFPHPSGAEYVWAKGVGGNTKVYLRHVVGGEKC